MEQQSLSACIIAGGRSSRFGSDKALYPYRGRPLIEWVIEAVRPAIPEIFIAADDAERFAYLGLPCYPDEIPGMGSLGGVYTALRRAGTGRVFVVACDMPSLSTDLVRHMAALSTAFDVTVPLVRGEFEPLHAVYARPCIGHVEKCIHEGRRRIISFFEHVSVRSVTEEEIRRYGEPDRLFMNINYPEDTGNVKERKVTPATDHSSYFLAREEAVVKSGLLDAGSARFYRDLFRYLDAEHTRYAALPAMPEARSGDLPLSQHGEAVLTGEALRALAAGASPLSDMMALHHPGLVLEPLLGPLAHDTDSLRTLVLTFMAMDRERMASLATEYRIGLDECVFIVTNLLRPYLGLLRERSAAIIPQNGSPLLCPFCGYLPDMAVIGGGDDGKRFLHCSLCGHLWQFKRLACAVCGTEDAAKLECLSSEDDQRYRIDVCHECGGYVKTVRLDRLEGIDSCDLTVENVITAGFDGAALREGYRRP
jgi:molybdenum cofactor guanylyltransferase